MDTKTTELIALGSAYAINCKPCLEYHRKVAVEAGVTESEMRAAIRVAEGVRHGAHTKTKGFAEELFGEVPEGRCCAEGSSCCP